MNYATPTVYDYVALGHTGSGSVVFQPLTPRAHEAFEGLPLDPRGCFRASSDDEANTLFERLDAHGLKDFVLG